MSVQRKLGKALNGDRQMVQILSMIPPSVAERISIWGRLIKEDIGSDLPSEPTQVQTAATGGPRLSPIIFNEDKGA